MLPFFKKNLKLFFFKSAELETLFFRRMWRRTRRIRKINEFRVIFVKEREKIRPDNETMMRVH